MKIKRIKSIKINCYHFDVKWNPKHNGGHFHYGDREIEVGTRDQSEEQLLMVITHELMEVCACEMNVRMQRPDCESDYIFVYDHRQHETMMNMFAGALGQFIA